MQQKDGPRCRLVVGKDTIVADVSGGADLSEAVNAAHNELRWLMEREDVAHLEHHEIINVDPRGD